jgi:hypothetical protein
MRVAIGRKSNTLHFALRTDPIGLPVPAVVLIGERNQPLDRHASTHLPIHAMADNSAPCCSFVHSVTVGACGAVVGHDVHEDY